MNVPAAFKITFISVLCITIGCLIGLGALAMLGSNATDPNAVPITQQNFSTACDFGWKAGLGGILGLLGGKATD